MLGKRKIKNIANHVLKVSKAGQTEVLVSSGSLGLTRFANNQIHQNLVRDNFSVNVRVVMGKKIGVGSTNALDKKSLTRLVEETTQAAKKQKEDPDFKSLPKPSDYSPVSAFRDQTAAFTPKQRAREVGKVIRLAKSKKQVAFGVFQTGISEMAVANSLGLFAYHPETYAGLNTTMMKGSQSGFASHTGRDVAKIETGKVAQKASYKAGVGTTLIEVPKGEYEVVLEEAAVNEMLIYLSYLGLGARAFHEGRSFLSGKLGRQVLGENITLWDDALNPNGLAIPFDYEGVAKKKMVLIEKGVVKNVVYDHYHAQKHQAEATGHGLPAPNTLDAIAGHLHLQPGKESLEALIGKVKKGLLVSRFWYVNAHHHNLVITGMTRDGTFLIENGKIVGPVHNLRFTQSIPQALNRVTGISNNVKVEESWTGANLVPALKITKFNFTGVSKL